MSERYVFVLHSRVRIVLGIALFFALAATALQAATTTAPDPMTTTAYVAAQESALVACWGGNYPIAALWPNQARDNAVKCEVSVNPSKGSAKPDLSRVQPGNIVVWPPHCNGASSAGQIGIVKSVDGKTLAITVDMSVVVTAQPLLDCEIFITVPPAK